MLEFNITDLLLDEETFEVPSSLGKWEFTRIATYATVAQALQAQAINPTEKVGITYYASLESIGPPSSLPNFSTACDEIIDICLILSFLNSKCVTPHGTTLASNVSFIQLGDSFVRPRSIVGFPEIKPSSLTHFFSDWLTLAYPAYKKRTLRLQLCHWLSGLTCFSLEDIFLSAGVQMDIVKQRERAETGHNLVYFEGMLSASKRYSLSPLDQNYKAMRNDIVHEGVLSGTNFPGKTKSECSAVVADTLNWLDTYVLAVLGNSYALPGLPRWIETDLEHGLPSLTII